MSGLIEFIFNRYIEKMFIVNQMEKGINLFLFKSKKVEPIDD